MFFLQLFVVILLFANYTKCDNEIENVLLLLADDAGFEMGTYLNKYCQTPNLDKLAKKSLIFNNAFTTVSSCSPSRAQILTGLFSHQNGMYGLHQSYHHTNVFDDIQSLPNLLNQNSNIMTGLIGKKNIGLLTNFQFQYEQTEEQHSINQIGRNITNMKKYFNEFLQLFKNSNKKNFFMQISFHDPHRCGHITPQYGQFCELWGNGNENMGKIPDWQPIYYDWENLLNIPSHLPQTDAVRKELAAQYMTISRLDQGIGLMIKELEKLNLLQNTLIIYTSDNGPPYPNGRTNLYDYGIRIPMLISSPLKQSKHNVVINQMTTLLDIVPTILDLYKIQINNKQKYYGKSLMPLIMNGEIEQQHLINSDNIFTNNLINDINDNDEYIYGSHNYHEITMNYPMRMVRTKNYKLIHNIQSELYYPIDQDLYTSDTFQSLLNNTIQKEQTGWFKTLKQYYQRNEWELYDLKLDPLESQNLYGKKKYENVRVKLMMKLEEFIWDTKDPWRCAPHSVLEETGDYKQQPKCLSLGHNFI